MKFSIKTVRAGSRLGTLTEIGSHQDKTVETPTCLLYSRAGMPSLIFVALLK